MTFKSVLASVGLLAFTCLLGCESAQCRQCSCQPACGCPTQTTEWNSAPATAEPSLPAYEEAPAPNGVNEAPPVPSPAPATEPEKLPAPAAAAAQLWRARHTDTGVRIVPR